MTAKRSVDLVMLAAVVLSSGTLSRTDAAGPATPLAQEPAQESALRIVRVEPTPLFPRPAEGQPLKQLVRLHVDNAGEPLAIVAQITAGTRLDVQALEMAAKGPSVVTVQLPDVNTPTPVTIDILSHDGKTLASQKLNWQPQKKWRIYCVAYSHHDLGFGNYPHRLRTEIRHANIERPLEYCRQTDAWDDDSKFRFMIETSEPITSFLGSHSAAEADEFARRVREGRIQIGALHNTANTEQLGHELMARLFYLSNRHSCDLLNVPASRTAQIDDVIGLTWPLATFCAEADIPHFFHGPNGCGHCLQPAQAEPVFYWQGPDRHGQVLVRSAFYGGYAGDNPGDVSETHILNGIQKLGADWPYDALLLQEGTDFQLVTLDTANRIHAWNAAWTYPRMICATMDMFFDAIAEQVDPARIKTFAKDSNNQWADQDANDARLLSQARRAGETIPTAEKYSTLATLLAGDGYPWTDIYQAYHRLLAYHEHTNAIDSIAPDRERMRRYETELEENREMVAEAQEFAGRALAGAFDKFASVIGRDAERTVIVFNPLARERTDVAHVAAAKLTAHDRLVDVATGREVAWQEMPDGTGAFVAANVPSLGYRCFAVVADSASTAAPVTHSSDTVLENGYYRVTFDAATGTITSIHDKELDVELVDQAAPHRFNEYLYERFESHDWNVPTVWHRPHAAQLTRSRGPVAEVMVVTASAQGVESLQQTVMLYQDLKRIDFVLDFVKSPSGRRDTIPASDPFGKESVYLALPWAVPEHQIRHELPGCVAEPITDLFEGACTAYYAVRHFSDVSNQHYGVTVSAPDSSLIEYDHPRSCPIRSGGEAQFEQSRTPPASSRMYLYLMDNMFDVNVRWDQPGPVRFCYSMRSHAGNWQAGRADEFGWDVMNPLLATIAVGKQDGRLPKSAQGFVSIDAPNVACTTIKPAEENGAGLIMRFVETRGIATIARVSFRYFPRIVAATETNLVEVDRPNAWAVIGDNSVAVTLRPFGVTTTRITFSEAPQAVTSVAATALSDMEVQLSWSIAEPPSGSAHTSHYYVYRGLQPDFQPTLLNLVQRPTRPQCVDKPQLHYGGWINNRLEPDTTYYYRVAAVTGENNVGPLSPPVPVTTRQSGDANMVPLPVVCLRAVLVSPLSRFNAVNLMWRTSCESDVRKYEVHRSGNAGFSPDETTRIAEVDAGAAIPGSTAYGHVPVEYRMADYDHMMYLDESAQPMTTCYYRVCAVDTAGQRGPFSEEVAVTTKEPDPLARLSPGIAAQSVYAPEYGIELAIDGSPDPYQAWISRPYGGGTKAAPQDVWWQIQLPEHKTLTLQGVKLIGDYRDVIPLQKRLQVQVRDGDNWKTVAVLKDAATKIVSLPFDHPVTTAGLRVFVPATDLPQSDNAQVDGIVRICELWAISPDGVEVPLIEAVRDN